jgi:hypothetical protein
MLLDPLHCYKKFIHAVGDRHRPRKNARPPRTHSFATDKTLLANTCTVGKENTVFSDGHNFENDKQRGLTRRSHSTVKYVK